jgi:hypothetical protein
MLEPISSLGYFSRIMFNVDGDTCDCDRLAGEPSYALKGEDLVGRVGKCLVLL